MDITCTPSMILSRFLYIPQAGDARATAEQQLQAEKQAVADAKTKASEQVKQCQSAAAGLAAEAKQRQQLQTQLASLQKQLHTVSISYPVS